MANIMVLVGLAPRKTRVYSWLLQNVVYFSRFDPMPAPDLNFGVQPPCLWNGCRYRVVTSIASGAVNLGGRSV